MTRIGIIGLGMMGLTHLEAWLAQPGAEVVAVADLDADRLHGRSVVTGNIAGQADSRVSNLTAKRYQQGLDLIRDPAVEAVDICVWTPQHLALAEAAILAGKHVLVEKPLARTAVDALHLAKVAETSARIVMPAMCMRFWPGWDWLVEGLRARRWGRVHSAHFRRVTSHPGGPFYSDAARCGGALLDLHIHDADIVQACFGMPAKVWARGYSSVTNGIDHVQTHYLFEGPDAPQLVTAEGAWSFAPGYGFTMQYTIVCEHATLVFDLAAADPLVVVTAGKREPVKLPSGMGYGREIAYFAECIRSATKPTVVTMHDAARSVQIIEAAARSIATGTVVACP